MELKAESSRDGMYVAVEVGGAAALAERGNPVEIRESLELPTDRKLLEPKKEKVDSTIKLMVYLLTSKELYQS